MKEQIERKMAVFGSEKTREELYKRVLEPLLKKTRKNESKYPELKEFEHLNQELAGEKGKQYVFEKVLIGSWFDKEIFTDQCLPEYFIVPKDVLENYRIVKKVFKKNLVYFETGIKMLFIHEREHCLEGAVSKADKIVDDKIRTVFEFSLGRFGKVEIKKLVKHLKNTEDKIENQTDLQTLLVSSNRNIKNKNNYLDDIAKNAAIYLVTQDILYNGIDSRLARTKEELIREAMDEYPSLNEEFVERIVSKQQKIIKDLEKEYENYEGS